MTKTYIIHQDTDNWYINKNLHYLIWIEPSLWTAILENQKIYLIFDARYINSIKKEKKLF